jgi:tripartite-type tricarboxylate transporter receptor subunit TctC
MPIARRKLLALATGVTALSTVPKMAQAQAYPTRPVRIVVGFPAGQTADIVARLMGQWLSDHLGQQFVIDNRPGASSNIATEAVVRASPDGYTLLSVNTSNFINATLYEKLPYNFVRDIAPVASTAVAPLVMVVNPSVPATTVAEFIALAKANPGKLNMGSGGVGNSTYGGRTIQDDGGYRSRACAISRVPTGRDRPDGGTGAGDVRPFALVHYVHSVSKIASAWGNHQYAPRRFA